MLAIFIHLGNNYLWDDLNYYLLRIDKNKFHLFINVMNIDDDIRQKIIDSHPNSTIFNFINKGCDIGPFLLFLDHLQKNNLKYDWIMKLHSKTNDNWRNRMFESLIPEDFDNFYKKLINENNNFYSSYNFIYDYFNIKYDVEYSNLFNLNLIYDWKKAEDKYQELKNMTPVEKNIYNNNKNLDKDLLPDIDCELFNHLFGDYKKPENIVNGKDKFYILKILKNLNNNSKLYYAPGTCFIAKYNIFEKYFKNLNIKNIYDKLEEGKPDDNIIQSRTHSLERVLCFLFQM